MKSTSATIMGQDGRGSVHEQRNDGRTSIDKELMGTKNVGGEKGDEDLSINKKRES